MLCLVAYILDGNLRHIETIRRWRGEFGTSPPFPIDDDTLVVGYSLWAEMTCFLQLGWRFPKYVYDLHTAYLSVSNILLPYNPDEKRIKQRKRLSDACCAYGIEGWEQIDKPEHGRGDRRGPLARIRSAGSAAILRRGRAQFGRAAAASDSRATTLSRPIDPAARHALERIQRQDRRPDSGPRHADRHGAVESGAGEQGGGDRRTDRAVLIPARAANIRSTLPRVNSPAGGSSNG